MRLYGIRRDDMTATPKRKVVGSTPIWDANFKGFNRIFNGFWPVNDKRDLFDMCSSFKSLFVL